jgi:hypothetical protein
MKKRSILFINLFLTVFLFIAGYSFHVNAVDGNEVVFDYDCQKVILTGAGKDAEGKPVCNLHCVRSILYDAEGGYITRNGKFCKYGSTNQAGTIKVPASGCAANPSGACPDSSYLPQANYPIASSQADTIMIFVRGGIYAVMGAVSLGVILLGMYGWYLRAMSEGNPDKVETSVKVYKNAIFGALTCFGAVIVVQLLFLFMGITDNPFDFNIIPKYGYKVKVLAEDVGRYCFVGQVDKAEPPKYHCDADTNRWVKN